MASSTYASPASVALANVNVTSVQVATPNPQRVGLYVFNPSSSVTLWVGPVTSISVAGANAIAVQSLQGIMLGPPNMPPWTAGLFAIAVSGPLPISIFEFYQ